MRYKHKTTGRVIGVKADTSLERLVKSDDNWEKVGGSSGSSSSGSTTKKATSSGSRSSSKKSDDE